MNLRDLIGLAAGNLWRMKLRSLLTIIGVVIAIATFTAMVSFGVGMQTNLKREFEKLGLMTKIQVFPGSAEENGEGASQEGERMRLNEAALDTLRRLPGVVAAYPFESFTLTVARGDSSLTAEAQGVTAEFLRGLGGGQFAAGVPFESDSARQVVLKAEALPELGLDSAEAAVGARIVISRKASSLDSGFARIARDMPRGSELVSFLEFDSLGSEGYGRRIARWMFMNMARSFSRGYFENKGTLADTLTVTGVLEQTRVRALRLQQVMLPQEVARRYAASAALDDPMTLFLSAREGTIPVPGEGLEEVSEYSKVTLETEPMISHDAIVDSVRAMGLRAFSFEQQFKQMRLFFALFNSGLGTLGVIALVVAALGIVNTMIMSILERQREIGVLKSLGADDSDIHKIFLVESGVIGLTGSLLGVGAGWLITRLAMVVVRHIPDLTNIPFADLFALPWWLVGLAMLFGLLVSLVAGLYPAARAARVDPVSALRND